MKIIKCEKDVKLDNQLKDKKLFIPNVIKLIYQICENDNNFKTEELVKRKKEKEEKLKKIKQNEILIHKLEEMQNDITRKLKVLDMENTSKREDLIYTLGGE